MFEIIKLLFDICLFRKGPQHLPYSPWLLRITVVVYALVNFLMINIGVSRLYTLLMVGVGILLVVGFSWTMLYFGHKRARFYQTTSALLGTDAMISFFAMPGVASMMTGGMTLLAFSVMIGLMIWHWAITGHIIRHALDQTLMFGLGLAFLYLLASYQVMALLFPEAAGIE
ncbi:MAG: hypothetical protein M8364_08020 [Methylobacter sp.]|uniref:hypothetical protein n=1 Tax=Methylobacter sp. TaxID=2051955 RepID=UPI00258974BB|nr:hypothetical protein [Methylobacter sp.]MCL7420832.1 hypothetical protein [Methylobacter sp.]